ncbi:dynein axonemal intermediate chain 2-like [Pectinophora gossypiella]|uniref:dynein axonemal intermediate chain 2-like n=1 Tax=Pectinophora gossypiella TaxID=13191 RepID=UPI00214E8EDC|nr:dynein axonemal intermediate chain 2-like [Pectinophora gossypiella]
MDISFQYSKKRCEFGRQPLFCEQGPDMCDSIPTDIAEHKRYILRNPVHQLVQNTPAFSEMYINTIRAEYTVSGANHDEGGWPRDINIYDPEATQRYRRKVEKDDPYIHCVMMLAPGMEHYILQNNAVDMYRTYYAEMTQLPPVEVTSCRTCNQYRDPLQRPVSSISWRPKEPQQFSTCYVEMDYYRVPRKATVAFIWDVENATSPITMLHPANTLLDLIYNPRDENLLVGGLVTGQVAVYDARRGGGATSCCPPHVAHRDLVRKVLFIHSKTGMEFFSGSPDGACKWWDLRKLDEPTEEMILDVVKSSNDEQSMATSYGVSALEYEPTIPTRFMVGTENGLVLAGNRKGKTPMEKLPTKIPTHNGPVLSLQRNPSFPKNYLTVGDWTVRVWSEDCRESAVLWSPPLRYYYTSGVWSPTRLSLMLMTGADGKLSLWDLLRRQGEPVLTMQLGMAPLLTQAFHEQGSLLTIGNKIGTVYLVELSHHLVQTDKNDKHLLTAIFERESKRERILEARLREIRLKQRQAEEGTPQTSATDLDPTAGDRDLAEAGTDFMQQVKKELALM